MLDEQIAEKHRREALKEKNRQRELQEEREQFRRAPPAAAAPPREAPAPREAPWAPAGAPGWMPYQAPQFSVSPTPAVPFALKIPPPPQQQQPSFLQQLHQQLLYQPLMQLPSLLAQPPQQQLPQLPALPKRSFWEVPSFHVAPARNPRAALPSLSPQRAESVESFRPPAVEVKRPSASESPRRRRQSGPLIDLEAEWRAWEARQVQLPGPPAAGPGTESSRESPVPDQVEKSSSEQSQTSLGAPRITRIVQVPETVVAPPATVVPLVPPARRAAESYGAGKLMEELQKVKRSWSDEREELRAEAEALKRQALKLQTQQVALPSPRMQFSGQSAAPVAFAAPNERLRVATLGQRRRAEALPLITLQEFRGTLRCLDAGGASLFLVEPEERYARDAVGSPSAAGPLPEGPAPEKCAQCQRPLAIDSNFCGSCGTNQKGSKKEDERTPGVKAESKGKLPEEASAGGSQMESTMKSAGKEEAEMSQFMSSLQYSDSSGRTPVADARTQRRPSQGFGKVVDLGAELKQSAGFEEKLSGQVSPGRTQDFLISALLNEETANPGGGPGKPPLAPGAKPKMPKAETTEEERSATPEGQAMKAMS